jgi:hypothetical protein
MVVKKAWIPPLNEEDEGEVYSVESAREYVSSILDIASLLIRLHDRLVHIILAGLFAW